MTDSDRRDWFDAFHRAINSFYDTSFLRTSPFLFNDQDRESKYTEFFKKLTSKFSNHLMLNPVLTENDDHCLFVPKITLSSISLHWHPLLSDYLFSFVLSTILRYHPHLLPMGSKDSFIAEAWSSQSAITALRYYLMAFTTPPIRLN